jgi:hypothetical protein
MEMGMESSLLLTPLEHGDIAGSFYGDHAFNIRTLGTTGHAFGLAYYSGVSRAMCRMKQRIAKNRDLRRKVVAIERHMGQEQT